MASKQDTETEEASAGSDFSLRATLGGLQEPFCGYHLFGRGNVIPANFHLLRHVETLFSEETEAILDLITKLDEIHALGLFDDGVLLFRILPLVSGAVLRFFEECLRNGGSREQCKCELL